MTHTRPTLHLVCGKIAAGKSTLCAGLASAGPILIAQDHWMSRLYKEELSTVADYVRLVARLRDAMGPHIVDVLRAGLSVVLDWPANTIETRAWMRGIFERADADHRLHYLDVPEDQCLVRLERRNAKGLHEYQTSPAVFHEITRYFQPPRQEEGFNVVTHRSPSPP